MRAESLLERLEPHFRRRGLDQVELYLKRGRSRRFEIGPQGRLEVECREEGWAVRAGGPRASMFACGTGRPVPAGPWPEPAAPPLRLPSPRRPSQWTAPPDLEAPLIVERQAIGLFETFERELARQQSGARLLRAVLEDGASRAELVSSRGVEARLPGRAATLYLEVAAGDPPRRVGRRIAARRAVDLDPVGLARRAADRLAVAAGERAPETEGPTEMVLAPAVAAGLLEGLLPLLVGAGARKRVRALLDRRGRLAAPALTIFDDGRLPGGVLEAPVDGEGMPTGRVALVEEGRYRQPLLSWREAAGGDEVASGCSRRPSWRDPPLPGPTHLFVRPGSEVAAGALIAAVERGYYLLEPLGGAEFDFASGHFRLAVCGFRLRAGRADRPLARGWLHGRIASLLGGIRDVARDLDFFPDSGLVGAPTLRVTGLELSG